MSAKKVFDRIYSTFVIVVNTVYGLVMALYTIGVMFTDWYNVEHTVVPVIMGAVGIVLVNVGNLVTRKYLKDY